MDEIRSKLEETARADLGDRKNHFGSVAAAWELASAGVMTRENSPDGLWLRSMAAAIATTYPDKYEDPRKDCIVVAVGEDGTDIIDYLINAMNRAMYLIVDNPRLSPQSVPQWLGKEMSRIIMGGIRIIDVLLDEEGGAASFTDSKKAQERLRRNIAKKNELLQQARSSPINIDEKRIQYHATIGVLLWREIMIDRATKESRNPTKPHWQDIELLLTVWTRLLHVPNFASNQWTDTQSLGKHVASLEENQQTLLIACIKKVVAILERHSFQLNAPFAPGGKRFVDAIFGDMPQHDSSLSTNKPQSLTDPDLSWLIFVRRVAETALSWTDEEISIIQNQLRTNYPEAVAEETQSQ